MSDARQGRPAPDADSAQTDPPAHPQASTEPYVAPDVSDLGSFEDLTEAGAAVESDAMEGFS